MKKTLSLLGLLFVLCGFLISCDSFMQAGEVKKQLEEMIAYANAPSYKITIEYNPDEGAVRAPALGETHKKVTDVFDLKFEPAKDHVFYKWEASSVDLPAGDKIEDYIEIENPLLSGTRATFKKELTNIVIKASAPGLPYTDITITGSKGKFSPSKGTYACIDTYTYPISFDPDQDYEFICWEIYDRNNDGFTGIIENGTYIEIDDIYSAETSYKLIAAPQDPDLSLGIRPVIAERPQILSCTPLFGVDSPKETSIHVIFDHDMDPYSIYYKQYEIDELIASGITDFLPSNNAENRYGYKKKSGSNELYYYKNISITDENGISLLSKYGDPVFETPRILAISPKDMPDWTRINVVLDKNFYYEEAKKPVTMPMSKKWVYSVTDKSDSTPPDVTKINVKSGGEILIGQTAQPGQPNLSNKIIDVDMIVQDIGRGPAESFTIELINAGDDTRQTKDVNYQQVTSQKAAFNGSISLKDLGLAKDSVYKMQLKISDGKEETVLPEKDLYYWFKINTSSTPVPSKLYCVKKEADGITVAWLPPVDDTCDSLVYSGYSISWQGQYVDGTEISGNEEGLNDTVFKYKIPANKEIASLNVDLWTYLEEEGNSTEKGSHATFDVFAEPVPELNFFMPIEDIFSISGRGTVATGIIERGIINISDTVRIIGNEYTKDTVITGVEINRQMFDSAAAGQSVGLLLRGVSKDDLSRGMFIIKPGVLQVHKKFKAYIYKKTKDEGGINRPFVSGEDRDWGFYMYITDVNGRMSFGGNNIIKVGEDRIAEIVLEKDMPIFAGEDFSIRTGGQTVGTGTILEIIE